MAEKPHSMFMFSSCERSYLYIVLVPSRCVLNEDNGKCNCEPCENLIEARGPGFVLKYGFKKRAWVVIQAICGHQHGIVPSFKYSDYTDTPV